MDGQLGFDGENTLAPRLISTFFEQDVSSSCLNDPDREATSDFKVWLWKRFLIVVFI